MKPLLLVAWCNNKRGCVQDKRYSWPEELVRNRQASCTPQATSGKSPGLNPGGTSDDV